MVQRDPLRNCFATGMARGELVRAYLTALMSTLKDNLLGMLKTNDARGKQCLAHAILYKQQAFLDLVEFFLVRFAVHAPLENCF